jgi:uncharacterized protein
VLCGWLALTGPLLQLLHLRRGCSWLRPALGVFSLLIALWPGAAAALEVPKLTSRVMDQAALLEPAERAALERHLQAYEQSTGHQFALLTVNSLDGDSIEDFGIRVAEAWKLGQKGKDDGLILLIAAQDRKLRIEVGYGLEGDIPDAIANRVIRTVLTPAFKQRQYFAGIQGAFSSLMDAAGGDPGAPGAQPVKQRAKRPQSISWLPVLALIVLMFLFFSGRGGGLGAVLLGSALGRGGGGFGGGGRGGFGGGGFGGGGGGFGGGGASGDW